MRPALACLLALLLVPGLTAPVSADPPPPADPDCIAAFVERPSTIAGGEVHGSVHYMTGRDFNITAGAQIHGNIFVPGTPDVFPNGCPDFGGVVDGTGSPNPSGYNIHISLHARLGNIVRRTDPVALPEPPPTDLPAGNRWVKLKKATDDPGDFATIKNLTIQARGLEVAVPPGAYGTFRINAGNTLTLGVAGATDPDVYSFENLVLNRRTKLEVVGPVEIRVKQSINLKGIAGDPEHPEWLSLSSQQSGLSIAPAACLYGTATFPNGTVTLHPRSIAKGQIFAHRLRLLPGSHLTCSADPSNQNDPPTADDLDVETLEDESVDITLTGTDPEGSPITFQVIDQPANGTLNGGAPNLTYVPNPGFFGTDTFTFQTNDGLNDSAPATVTINVIEVNEAPIAQDLQIELNEGEVDVAILLQAVDPDDDPITYEVLSSPTIGTLSGTPPDLLYSHNDSEVGADPDTDSFTYRAIDNLGNISATATVTLTILPVNDPPVSGEVDLQTDEDTAVTTVLAATDPEGDPLTYSLVVGPDEGPANGSATVDSDGTVVYTPAANYHGTDGFSVQVQDPSGATAALTITVTINPVNDPPVPVALDLQTNEDTALSFDVTAGDVDGDALTYTVNLPAGFPGTVTGSGPGFVYTPAANFFGPVTIPYSIDDGTVQIDAVVNVTVLPVNDAPVASDLAVTTEEDTAVVIVPLGSDVDGDPLTFDLVPGTLAHGTLVQNPDGTFTFTPGENETAGVSFQYLANDGTVDSAPATVTITINAVNDPPVADDLAAVTNEDTTVIITPQGNDVDGDPLNFTLVAPSPVHGSVSQLPDGTFSYTPGPDATAPVTFGYVANDGTADSAPATVSVTIVPFNDPPQAPDLALFTDEDSSVFALLFAFDAEGDPLTYTVTTPPANGTLSGSAPNLTYTPNPDFSGGDTFTYTANDGTADSDPATVTVTVNPINDPPVASVRPSGKRTMTRLRVVGWRPSRPRKAGAAKKSSGPLPSLSLSNPKNPVPL